MLERIGLLGLGAAALVAGTLLGGAGHAVAQGRGPIVCGTSYTVQRGDTLHDIARRAYPTPNFQAIYQANRSSLRSPSEIEVGDILLIPCLDGTGFQTREAALAARDPGGAPTAGGAAPTAPEQTAPQSLLARIVVLSEAPPFAGRRLPEGGMVTELVSRAMLRVPNPVDYDVVFDESGTATTDALTAASFDLAFPVARPDCARGASLGATQRSLCDGFIFSAPIASSETRFYVRAGDELEAASDPGIVVGRRVCRSGALPGDELPGTDGTHVETALLAGCFATLEAGGVDLVVASGADLDRATARLGVDGRVSEIGLLRESRAVHAIAPIGNARGEAFIATLDSGLADTRRSGEWAVVVANHLAY